MRSLMNKSRPAILFRRLCPPRQFLGVVIFLLIFLFSMASPGAPAPHRAPHVPWIEDASWSDLVAQAEAAGQPILIDFYASWCGPCKALDALVYNETEVINELVDVKTFKVDTDKVRYDELERDFGITSLPTLVWCTPQGAPFARFTGFVTTDTFLVRIRRWKKALILENALMARLDTSPKDPKVLLAAYEKRQREGRLDEAAVYRGELMAMNADTQRHGAVEVLIFIATQEMLTKASGEARDLARHIETMFPPDGKDLDRDLRHDDLLALANLVSLQTQLPDTLGVLETYSHMINLDRGYLPALTGFARTALAAGIRLPQATTCALRAVIRSDNRPDLVALLAECYDRRNYHARAVRWMKKAVAQDPENADFQSAMQRYRASCPSWLLSSP